jgi:hypothetical protein
MTDIATRARTWIATGYGTGTYTVWAHMMGVKDFYVDNPHDKGDFRRVIDLVQAVPEWEDRIREMADLSPTWSRIAARWDELKKDPAGISKIVDQPAGDKDRMLFRITAMMARSNQPGPDWSELKASYAAMPFDERVNGWIVGGDVGQSSKTIWAAMLGIDLGEDGANHPHDPADLGRCLRLLELMPEWTPRLPELAALDPCWHALVEHWNDLSSSMEDEVGIAWEKGKSAPATYALMRTVIDDARRSS